MGLVKTADQILQGRPRPVDGPGKRKGVKLGRRCEKVPGCIKKHWGHGFCRPHGRKWLKWGDPLHKGRGKPPKCVCVRCPVHAPDNVAFRDR